MLTRSNKEEGPRPDHQHGTVAAFTQKARGGEKYKEGMSKKPKTPKDLTGDPPRDMRDYALKMSEI